MRFVTGLACDLCGLPLPGGQPGETAVCDDCAAAGRRWHAGRAALVYEGGGRRLVLALKHGDRPDLALAGAVWLERASRDLPGDVALAPVPVHWTRLLRRRYSPAAELARALAERARGELVPDALERTRRTPSQDGRSVEDRHANLSGAIRPRPKAAHRLAGRNVVLVDDVMTSGATIQACADACHAAGARAVFALVLARAAKSH